MICYLIFTPIVILSFIFEFNFTPTSSFNCFSAGHAMWPAIVVDESLIGDHKGLSKILGGQSIPVQFFGTHDFARFVIF